MEEPEGDQPAPERVAAEWSLPVFPALSRLVDCP